MYVDILLLSEKDKQTKKTLTTLQFKIAAIIRIQIPNSNTFILRGVSHISNRKFHTRFDFDFDKKKVSFDKLQIIIIYSQWRMEREMEKKC